MVRCTSLTHGLPARPCQGYSRAVDYLFGASLNIHPSLPKDKISTHRRTTVSGLRPVAGTIGPRRKTLFSAARRFQANLEGEANFCSFALCLANRSAVY